MLKRLRLSLPAITALFALTACQGDSVEELGGSQSSSGNARVTLRIATDNAISDKASTRAWQDSENAKTDRTEMMYSWHVILVDASNKVVFKKSSTTVAEANAEIDIVAENLELAAGTYTAYSFANIPVSSLPAAINKEVGADFTSDDATTLANATYTVNGNGFEPSANNGIPMSNKQTLNITASDTEKDLIVIRMLAKMEVSFENKTGADATVQSFTISDITTNAANNLKLLPSLTSGANTMDAVHGDIQPNLYTSATASDYTVVVNKTIANNAKETVTFYINESATPSNADGLFYLTVKMNDTDYRYALISSQSNDAAKANYKWNYIARNDYRILPIVLDEYKLELIPYDFPPIGVYPVSVREIESDLYEMTFHDYGHFHLVPKVTKDGSTSVPYSAETPTGTAWTLDTNFAGSWKTAATEGGAWVVDDNGNPGNPDGFYRADSDPSNPIIAATSDGDEVGGVPVWYANTSSPQWDPAGGTNFVPFIFGYIADPGGPMTADKKIYHEFRVNLYVGGVYRRDLLYRFYMKLPAGQMMLTRQFSRSPYPSASKHP